MGGRGVENRPLRNPKMVPQINNFAVFLIFLFHWVLRCLASWVMGRLP